ncbi:MAG TPA: hypothetical protein VFI33_11640 [Puia sp.]|nr:hypothetical protein [Puia sp.]
MKRIFILLLVTFLIDACHSTTSENPDIAVKKTDTAKKNYLPVAYYLKAEIAGVDSFPQRIMKYQISQGKTDSGIITTAVFDQLANEFMNPELDSAHFENKFEENSFIDRSTNLVSFTYSTKDTGNGLKRVDVLLSPGSGYDKLNSIYMESISKDKDSTLISKMSWKAGRNFNILHIRQPNKGPETMSQTIVVWDSRE